MGSSPIKPDPYQLGMNPQTLISCGNKIISYLFNFASAATKKITESVAETAQTIRKSVEEGKIDGIIDKTIIGDFQKEQKKFVEEQHTKKSEAAVPPWVDSHDEETIQQQILALSATVFPCIALAALELAL
ncbi:synapse-associated protein 1 [Cricetulus griseus]|uniref:Synapse-associated protein 1 n=1 Tax=Cricetulus griseus TaxID=10029 RepID=A0A061HUQ7_CRIGR|nr:synapse-associated protein 1 [Cricetulus griseus]